jgi:amidase
LRRYTYADSCPIDDAEVYDGAPVAVQIVGRRFEEEKILVLAEVLDEALGRANS